MAASAPAEDALPPQGLEYQQNLSFHSIQPPPVPPPVPPPEFYEPMVRGSLLSLNVNVASPSQPHVPPQSSVSWAPPPPPSWPPPPETPVYPVMHHPQFPHRKLSRLPPPRYPSVVTALPHAPPSVRRRRPLCLKILSAIVIVAIIAVAIIIVWEVSK